MFKNVFICRLQSFSIDQPDVLESFMQAFQFIPCSGSQEKSVGWVPPRGQAHGPLFEVVAGHVVLKFMSEVKVVPSSVVKRMADEKAKQIENSSGRKPGKKEMREMREDLRVSLLPMAFTKVSTVMVWIDPSNNSLVLDVSSLSKADEVITLLMKTWADFSVKQLNTNISPSTAMSNWLLTHESPDCFSIERECELKADDESKSVVRYTRHSLNLEEISQHIVSGKLPTRLALTWKERVSFVLSESGLLKKVSFTDIVFEDHPSSINDVKDDSFDSDVAIATGELSQLLPDLIESLGGELALV